MKIVARDKSETGVAAIDPWSLVNVGSGITAGMYNLTLPQMIIAAIATEAITSIIASEYEKEPESAVNKVFDVLSFVVGWKLGTNWNKT